MAKLEWSIGAYKHIYNVFQGRIWHQPNWLSWTSYNTSFHSSLKMSPLQILYSCNPLVLFKGDIFPLT